jgi:hypothetical protein
MCYLCPSGKYKVKTGCPKELFTCPMCYLCPSGKYKVKTVARKSFLLVQCVKYQQKKAKYLVVCWAILHGYLLALLPILVVPGKQTVLSVEP